MSRWVNLDIWTCNQPPDVSLTGGDSFCFFVPAMEDIGGYYWNLRLQTARLTYGIGLALLFLGVTLLWSGAWMPRFTVLPDGTALPGRVTISLAIVRFLIVYILGASAVCIWRGIWCESADTSSRIPSESTKMGKHIVYIWAL